MDPVADRFHRRKKRNLSLRQRCGALKFAHIAELLLEEYHSLTPS